MGSECRECGKLERCPGETSVVLCGSFIHTSQQHVVSAIIFKVGKLRHREVCELLKVTQQVKWKSRDANPGKVYMINLYVLPPSRTADITILNKCQRQETLWYREQAGCR